MKIVKDWPPNIDDIRNEFDLPEGVIFTYGDTIYNPHGVSISEWLLEHEKVHMKQQQAGVEDWWKRYLEDPAWRLEQELEAHQREFRVFCNKVHNREKRNKALVTMASRLASPMYGNLINVRAAMIRIR